MSAFVRRLAVGSLLAVTTVGSAVQLSSAGAFAAGAVATGGCAEKVIDRAEPAGSVARRDTAALRRAALANHITAAQLRHQATEDDSLWLDQCGVRYYVEEKVPASATTAAASLDSATATHPLADTFTLQSKPGSNRTIYLDFTGETVSGTGWNKSYNNGADLVATPYSIDATVSTAFSDAELTQIQRVWQIVAEDYAPFDVNVTTQDPGAAAIDRTDSADQLFGTRALITGGGPVYNSCRCGGIAYVNVFTQAGANHSYYQPAWVFTSGVGTGGKNIGEAAAHEIGHNFGLNHDGTSTQGYYTGSAPWAPIMGASYYQPVTQWSMGEYSGANNKQDDLAVIAAGAPLRTDEFGDAAATATPLTADQPINGVIGTRTDVDTFTVTGSGGTTISVTPADGQPNLDVKLTIRDAAGNVVAAVDPAVARTPEGQASGLGASWTGELPAGGATYTATVDGVGTGDPLTAGRYSDYASLGNYQIVATASATPPPANTVTVTNPGAQNATVGTPVSLQVKAVDSAAGQTLTYSAAGLPAGLSINAGTGLISGTPTTAGTVSTTVTVKDTTGATGTATFSWTVAPAATPCTGQKLGNPGFETGTAAPWAASTGVISNSTSKAARTGSWKAWLGGNGRTSTESLSQQVTIPAGCKATLKFWLSIDSAESTWATYDTLTVKVGTTTLASYSNRNKGGGYVERSFDLSAYAGQTVTLSFNESEDFSLQTSFVVDDTSLTLS